MATAVSDGFRHPLGDGVLTAERDGDGYHVLLDFYAPSTPFGPDRVMYRLGEDWTREDGDDRREPVFSVSNGLVIASGRFDALGYYVAILHSLPYAETIGGALTASVVSFYAGLEAAALPGRGAYVAKGEEIGHIGPGGGSDPPQLHFQMLVSYWHSLRDADGYRRDPRPPQNWLDPTDFIEAHRSFRQVALPDLVVRDGGVSGSSFDEGDSITVTWDVANIGAAGVPSSRTGIYLSVDGEITRKDSLLVAICTGALAPGAVDADATSTFALPINLPPGTYHIGILADRRGYLNETDKTNNAWSAPITIRERQIPDLTVEGAGFARTHFIPGDSIALAWQVGNVGNGDAPESEAGIYLTDVHWSTAADRLLATYATPALAPQGVDTGAATIALPQDLAPGTYYLRIRADRTDLVSERREYANDWWQRITVTESRLPDLVIQDAALDGSVFHAGAPVTLRLGVANIGQGFAPGSTVVAVLSPNQYISERDTPLRSFATPALLPGEVGDLGSVTVTLPSDLVAGTYHIAVVADRAGALAEEVESNNIRQMQITVLSPHMPDLVVAKAKISSHSFARGATGTLDWVIANIGTVEAPQSTTGIYFSHDAEITGQDRLLNSAATDELGTGESQAARDVAFRVPAAVKPGTYYIGLLTDPGGHVMETDEANNDRVFQVSIW